eukprot:gene745-809_t
MIGLKRQKTYDIVPENLISVRGLSMQFIELILEVSDEMKTLVASQGGDDRLKHKVLAAVFYEPSTRTSCSFQAAMLRLGGSVVTVNEEQSSVKKGESLEDTIQTMSCYCDVIVLRHPQKGSAEAAATVATKPVINAGDGTGEHPSQALLDLYTIKSELGYIGGASVDERMIVTFLGDLKNGRTVHSLALLLSMFPNMTFIYVAPPGLEVPRALVDEVRQKGVSQIQEMTLEQAVAVTDVLYVTRIQKERFSSEEEYNQVTGSYCVDGNLMTKAKQTMVVMHPLPRVNEIHTEVDIDPRAAYFRQMENGMYVRMALLNTLLLR